MSTKTSTQQPPGRRTPLSLNPSTKHPGSKPAIDNNKKESNTNNQKTEAAIKKDNPIDKKVSSEKKPVDSKKTEPAKSQNGVSTNGANGSTSKPKTDSSSGPGTPKKDIPKKEPAPEVTTSKNEGNKNKAEEKKKDRTSEEVTKKVDEKKKDKTSEEVARNVDEKKKDKTSDEVTKKVDEKTKEVTEVVEKKKIDVKPSEEKTQVKPKVTENVKKAEKVESKAVDVINLDSSGEKPLTDSPVKDKKTEEVIASKTPQREKKLEEPPKQEATQVESSESQSDDVEMMEPLTFEADPSEPLVSASSTPAKSFISMDTFAHREDKSKYSPKSETKHSREPPIQHTPDRKSCPRTFSSISGRRSIRPIGDYTFTGNLQIRESYRKINTELDFTSSSLNVTVGSEVPNNDSFSFFSRTRKRERSSPTRQSAMEVQGDLSPKSPKRARIEFGMAGFFNAVASPITMLRARLSRATVQSTPKKEVETPIDDDMVENVSGICVEEETTATEDFNVNPDSTVDYIAADDDNPKCEEAAAACSQKTAEAGGKHQEGVNIKENITTSNPQAKRKCSIM